MRQKEQKKDKKERRIKILVTGDQNYNNQSLFIRTMDQIFRELQGQQKHIGTYGSQYGAQLLANAYALQKDVKYIVFDERTLKSARGGRAYWISLQIGVKWADIIVVFSSIMTPKLKNIISSAKRKEKQIIVRK